MAAGLHYRLDWNVLDSYMEFQEMTAPGTPQANDIRQYAKDSSGISTICWKNDAGTEICLPTSGVLITGVGVANRVAFWDGVSNLSSDADLTFLTDTLTATKIIGVTSITDSGLVASNVIYAGTGGLLSGHARFAFAPDHLSLGTSSVIQFGDNTFTGVLNTLAGLTINIDADNSGTTALLAIQANTDLRLTGGTRLFTINESGALALGNAVDFGVSGQALITQGNAASPTWVTLVTDHGALSGLLDDDHTQYRLEAADHTHQSTGLEAGTLDHGLALTGLTDDDHVGYLRLVGRAGGQTAIGGTAAGDDLTLRATAGVGAGSEAIILQVGSNGALEALRAGQANSQSAVAIGTSVLDITNASTLEPRLIIAGAGVGHNFQVIRHTTVGGGGGIITISATRGAGADTHSALQAGDGIGTLLFGGSDGTRFLTAATITASVATTFTTDTAIAAMAFSVNDGTSATTPPSVMSLSSAGILTLPKTTGRIDISAITAGTPNLVVTATTDVPVVVWSALGTNPPSTAPAGYIEILVGANPRYIPFWA